MSEILGCGGELHRPQNHPYIGRASVTTPEQKAKALAYLNDHRDNSRGESVEVTYYYEVVNDGEPMQALTEAAKMILDHGTLKPWHKEGDASVQKPADYDEFMSWATDIDLLGYNKAEAMESGLVKIAYPLHFFDKRADRKNAMAQLLMAAASEPFSAFSFYRGAKIVDMKFPKSMQERFPGQNWSHRRVRDYLGLSDREPIIGTIVKPKTGLTPELFSRCIVEAALTELTTRNFKK